MALSTGFEAHSALTQLIISGLTLGSIYALVGLGFALIYNATDVINFAQGEFVMMGGMIGVILARAGAPLPVVILGGAVASALIGAVVYQGLVLRARRATVATVVILTLGLSVVLQGIALQIWGSTPLYLAPFTAGNPFHVLGGTVTYQAIWILGAAIASVVLLQVMYRRTQFGRAMVACAVDREGACLVGIDTRRMALVSFALSGAFGGLAGVLIGPIASVSYNEGIGFALKGFAAAALGGMGSPAGALVGGLAIGLTEASLSSYGWATWSDTGVFVVLIVVLVALPTGLLRGRAERRHTAAL